MTVMRVTTCRLVTSLRIVSQDDGLRLIRLVQ